MRARTPAATVPGRVRWTRAALSICSVLLLAAPVRAQTRSASVRVHVTVLDFAASDVIGVHGVAPAELIAAPAGLAAGTRRNGESWRITTGGSSAVGVRLESVGRRVNALPAVSLCEVAGPVETCRSEHIPASHIAPIGPSSELLLRLGSSSGGGDDGRGRSVRLTLDYIGS